jgi:ADP-ribosyl-[dinitrogen reductase] hydrolase
MHGCSADENRMKGCFFGCAVGDALGAPLEFHARDELPLVTEMIPAEHWKLPAGSWTDDTSLMLCLAASIAARGGLDAHSELSHYMEWFSNGYLAVNGVAFDMGRTVTCALADFETHGYLVAHTTTAGFCGNGSLMRLAPVPIFVSSGADYERAWRSGYESSKTTHSHPLCCESCGLYSVLIVGALHGKSKHELLEMLTGLASKVTDARLVALCDGGFIRKTRDQIRSHGFVLDTLEAALWSFFNTDSFESGAILAVNLAHDADTVGAVYGTLAGAFYGYSEIPTRWLSALQGQRLLDGVWTDLFAVATAPAT